MAQKISNLPVGAKVKDNLSKYNGKPVIWKIADKNHSGYPSNTVTLISDKILSIKAFDAMENRSSNSDRRSYGNNNYKNSNLLQWLNSGSSNWYSAQHGADAPPSSGNVWSNYNAYDNEPGFLYNFSSDFKNAMVSTSLKTARSSTDGSGSENVTSKIFLASTTEVGLDNENGIAEGTRFPIFDGNDSRKAYPTSEAVSKSNYTSSSLNASSPWWWWLRTPYASGSHYVRIVYYDGSLYWNDAYLGYGGVRPLCNLKSEILVSNSTDSDGAYTIEWNQPPTTPSDINVPSKVQAGKSLEVTWGTSSDPEGNSVGYILERKVDNGSYSRIYKGINRSYADRITKGWQNVTYRVKAYDNYGSESGYRTSSQRTVNNNADPVINSNSSSNLGTKTGAFNLSYSVSDPDTGQALNVKEYLNGVQKRSFSASSGSNYSFNISSTEWQEILNGTQRIKIVVTDSEGGRSEKEFTFTKNENEILFELKTPLNSDAMVTKALLTLIGQIPSGAISKIEICNNGYDSNPTWEDVTTKVERGSKIFLTNKTKTASKWGVNIRVSVKRNGASGECYIASTGGNFE